MIRMFASSGGNYWEGVLFNYLNRNVRLVFCDISLLSDTKIVLSAACIGKQQKLRGMR